MSNIHSQTIPKDLIDEFLMKLDEAVKPLRPYLSPLTPESRKTILKMGDKSLALVEKTSELAAVNPQFCPSYFNLSDLNIDLTDAVSLRVVVNRLEQITREVEDTMMIAGNEAFTQTLTFYNAVKQAARDNVPGAQALFDELKKRFAFGRPRKGDVQE
ncbi:MAG: hypothetical protein LBB73_02180 [Dysgonamonadaceae bacterium]|jgi:hypothetical protein|nr:hypothetical protein [Dysgonamonadaceae bacterium]